MKKMIRSSLMSFAYLPAVVALLVAPAPLLAKQGVHIVGAEILVEEETDDSGVPDDIDGPLIDKMSDSGALFGDLYRLARYKGFEVINGEKVPQSKKVPAVDPETGLPVTGDIDWTDPEGQTHRITVQLLMNAPAVGGEPVLTEDYASILVDEDVTVEEGMIVVENTVTGNQYIVSPSPSQCVQPVADEKWDISNNLLPLLKTYDPTWGRTECEVSPEVFLDADEEFEGVFEEGDYHNTIYYTDLVQEVEFGRLNLARAPQAVLDASFDEAISTLNAAKDIKIDASGRLLVTTEVYDEFLLEKVVDDGVETYQPLVLDTVEKAIDSPKENLALYLKLMKDGHLITPAAERVPIDFSLNGGIPLDQLTAIEDGPSNAPRPTIDIDKMISFGLGNLVDAPDITEYIITVNDDGTASTFPCPEGSESCDNGILTASDTDCAGDDFPLAASFFSAAADKKGNITVDKVVYINSILGINKVTGTGIDDDGNTINYAKHPVYFNYNTLPVYDRLQTFGQHRGRTRGDHESEEVYEYDGMFEFLDQTGEYTWEHKEDYILKKVFHVVDIENPEDPAPPETEDIGGFNSMADDDLQVIIFTHTYQIPGLR
jgi:hypothetical protein